MNTFLQRAAAAFDAFFDAISFASLRRKIFPARAGKTAKRRRGDFGEELAAKFLKKECAMKILCRNFCAGRDEIDIVALDGETLVFVEVKTRSERDLRGGLAAVDSRKRRALHRAAGAYLRALRERPAATRLDVVEVYLPDVAGTASETASGTPRIVHHCAVPWRLGGRR